MYHPIRDRGARVAALAFIACVFLIPIASAAVSPSVAVLVQKIAHTPAFSEPLIPMGATTRTEDDALLHALAVYEHRRRATDFTPFVAYLHRYARSPWAVAIWTNEGLIEQTRGYYDKAIQSLNKAWTAGRQAHGIAQKSLVDYAVANLARLEARFADVGPLTHLVQAVHGRTLIGSSAPLFASALQSLGEMQHEPELGFRCGPMALKSALVFLYPKRPPDVKLCVVPVTRKGMTLTRLQALAHTVGLPYVMARPTAKAHFPIPSILHWRVNHYATLVGHDHGLYKVWDPGFNHAQWFTRRALMYETTAVLVPKSALKHGFAALSAHQGGRIWGRGYTYSNDLNATSRYDKKVHLRGQPQKSCKSQTHSCTCPGMAHYSVSAMLVSLRISDTPLSYTPPKGPPIRVTFTYNEDDVTQPANFTFGNVGPQWATNWTSYIEENNADPYDNVFRVFPGGGGEQETMVSAVSGSSITYATEPLTGAQLFKIGPAAYKRVLPNGAVQVYSTTNNATTYPRDIFLTSITGPHGNTVTLHYDSQLRLTSITDALGQVTTFQYANSQYPLEITSVTDPFGHTTKLTYDSEGRLTSTTDPLGMTSSYTYQGMTDTITALTTPYGTTQFQSSNQYEPYNGDVRTLTVTDPLGHTEKIQYIQGVESIPFYDPNPPSGVPLFTSNMNMRDTYIWDPAVYARYPNDYTKAKIDHWLHSQEGLTSRVLESVKYPLQHWLWYVYPNQFWVGGVGTLDKPSAIAVQLGDGSTSLTTLDRNAIGKVTEQISPDGYKTFSTYAANNVDLLKVQQQTPQGLVTLATYTYNSQHEPLTITNAAGGTTTNTYNAAGQLTSRTDPLGQTTKYVYDSAGYLTSVINPNGQTEANFTYDTDGRVASYTNAAGTTVDYSYDALNRLTGITYPDGTTRTYTYQNLNVVAVKNRLNQVTRYGYDADGHLISVTDPTGAVTTLTRNPDEKVIAITDPNGHTTQWTRDVEERVISRVGPLQHTTAWVYGIGAGRLQSVTDPLGQTTQYTYTLGGKVSKIQYLHALVPTAPVSFTYGQNFPHLIAMTDGTGTTHYAYGAVGSPGALRLTTVQTPVPKATIQYGYDADNDLIHQSINGQTQTFGYDALNRLTSNTNVLGAFSYRYLGQTALVTQQSLAGSPVTLAYRYLPATEDNRLQAIVNTISRGRPPASFFYHTNALDEITRIQARSVIHGGGRSARSHDRDEGDRAGSSLFAPVDHLTDALFGREGEDHKGRSFGPRSGGSVGALVGVASVSYDADQRLVGTTGNLFGRTRYGYDAANNLLTVQNAARPFRGTYDAANDLTSANGQPVTVNADGELLTDGPTTATWDAAQRLASVTNSQTGVVTTFTYNGLGERVATTTQAGQTTPVTTDTLWCGTTICAAFTPSGTITAQYFPQGEVDGSAPYLYLRNAQGSVTALASPRGGLVAQYAYSPYGQEIGTGGKTPTQGHHGPRRHGHKAATPTPTFGYAGMIYNASTGLDLTLYRAYDPQLRRWLSRDPIGMMSGLALIRAGLAMPMALGGSGARWVGLNLAINRYPYVGNNPLNWGDPNGDITFKQWSFALLSAYCIAIFRPADIPEPPVVAIEPQSIVTPKK